MNCVRKPPGLNRWGEKEERKKQEKKTQIHAASE